MISKKTRIEVFGVNVKHQLNKKNMLPITAVRSVWRINWSIGWVWRPIFVPVALLVTWNTDMSFMNKKLIHLSEGNRTHRNYRGDIRAMVNVNVIKTCEHAICTWNNKEN